TVPGPLRDRMEVIRLSGYTENEKVQIAKKHLIPELLSDHGLTPDQVTVTDEAVLAIIRDYTAEAGVRNLERKLANVMRKIARKVAGAMPADAVPVAAGAAERSVKAVAEPVESPAPAHF